MERGREGRRRSNNGRDGGDGSSVSDVIDLSLSPPSGSPQISSMENISAYSTATADTSINADIKNAAAGGDGGDGININEDESSDEDEVMFLGTNKSTTMPKNSNYNDTLLPHVNSMKIDDIKSELESHGISTTFMVDKEELVDTLRDVRSNIYGKRNSASAAPGASSGDFRFGLADYRAEAKLKYEQSSKYQHSTNYDNDSHGIKSMHQPSNNNPKNRKVGGSMPIRNLSRVETLNAKQSHAFDLAIRQGKNIFITGPAGTGKSVLIKHIMAAFGRSKKRWVATSSTGTTAVALGGETLHHFAGCGVPSLVADFGRCFKPRVQERWSNVDVLIVDEVSMLSGEFLDHLNDVVKQIRHDSRAYGGCQLILCGDFFQLPPIERRKSDVREMLDHGKKLGRSSLQ